MKHVVRCLAAAAVLATLGACGSAPTRRDGAVERGERTARGSKAPSSTSARTRRGGGYYLDDGPGDSPPPDIDTIPDAVPRLEPLARGAMRPYVVMGQTYTPMTELTPYKARGIASWYGRRYHGKRTSSGEIYDMYSMSAAHPVLPIPSYVRVTNVATGKSVIVRVNDRGPFVDGRLIDLSYTAAHRIGVLGGGSALVEVESILPDASGPGTMFAAAPPRNRIAAASAPRAAVEAAAPAAAPAQVAPPVALTPATALSTEPDPILAIAAAARDPVPSGRPLAEPQAATPQPYAIATARVEPPPPAPSPEVASGVYLQLGAFGSRQNAESYLAHTKVQFDWLADRLQVRERDGLYRVHVGPYATSNEARLAAERIATALGTRPVVVTR